MSYVALYRKFRPQTFDEVRGQDHVVRTLRNQVKTGRLQHAYLFTGTRGTGKTSVAKILARAVNCGHPADGNPCGECAVCRKIRAGSSMNVIEIDAASNNGVDHIREIIDEVQYRPTEGNYKVYIIDEVHMLSPGAFNALLKTLEEPPEYVIFVLATTEVGRIPVTILSRCQRYDFRRIDVATITEQMRDLTEREGAEAEEKALRFIARAADGSMRDALSLLDRCLAFYMGETLTYERALRALGEADTAVFSRLTGMLTGGNVGGVLREFGRQIGAGMEIGQFVTDFIRYLRNLLVVQTSGAEDAEEIVDLSAENISELRDIAESTDADTSMRYIRILSDLQNRMRYAANRRVLTETALIMMAKPQGDRERDALTQRIRQLEDKMEEILSGAVTFSESVSAAPPPEEVTAAAEAEALPEAAPEDLRRVVNEWKELLAQMPDSLLKNRLRMEGHPQFQAETLERRLYVELDSSINPTVTLLLTDEGHVRDNQREIERMIEKRYGFHIDVELHSSGNRPAGVKDIDIGETMRNNIMMKVEEVPDTEDDLF